MTPVSDPEEYVSDAVGLVYREYNEMVSTVGGSSPSALTALNRVYPKHILIAAASSLEDHVKVRLLPELFERYGNVEIREFLSASVLKRGYHGLFEWSNDSASKLFSAFGAEAKARFKERTRTDPIFDDGQRSFMQLGRLRNELVHNDYVSRSITVTPGDVHIMYKKSLGFLERIELIVFGDSDSDGESSLPPSP